MGRVIALGPGGKAQAPERDDSYRPVLDQVIAMGLMNQFVLSPVIQSEEKAREVKNGLYRSARYYCSCGKMYCTRKYGNVPGQNESNPQGGCPLGGQRLSVQAEPVRDEDGFIRVQFRVMDKRDAMRAVVQKYGPDPNKWPYFAKRKKAST